MSKHEYISKRKDTLPPCGRCPDKYTACSASCTKPEYLQWRELVEKRRMDSINESVRRNDDWIAREQRFRKT